MEMKWHHWTGMKEHNHNTSFSSQPTNESSKLECYISQGWKGLAVKNTALLGLFVNYKEKYMALIMHICSSFVRRKPNHFQESMKDNGREPQKFFSQNCLT